MKMTIVKRMWGATLLFGICIFLFFFHIYPFHICYQEQYQLFLFDSSYAAERLSYPGGFAEYVATFLTQFFISPMAGALIIAILLVLLQRLVYAASSSFGKISESLYPLSFLPSVYYWILLCNENYMLVGLVAPLMALGMFYFCVGKQRLLWWGFYLLIVPLLWFLVGISCWVWLLLWVAYEWRIKKWSRKIYWMCVAWGVIICIMLPVFLKYCGWMYPLRLLFWGTSFFRYPLLGTSSVVFVYLMLLLFVPLLMVCLSKKKVCEGKRSIILFTILFLFVFGGGSYSIYCAIDLSKEEIIAYDYYTSHREWKKVIELADEKAPSTPLSVACLNLALCKEGLMADRMFNYYQHGTEGLLPSFTKDFTVPLIVSEIYYHIGFVNTAQRYAFESMECIPNRYKNVRVVKRLAETNIINGEYAVARKYLKLLQHTLFYSRWATETLAALSDEKLVEQNTEWMQLRKYQTKEDFIFSENEQSSMLGFVFSQDPTNRVAYEYLMALCLLRKDLNSFLTYYPMGKSIGYARIPESYQEALVYVWGLQHKDMTSITYPIDSSVLSNVAAYGKIYTSYANAEPMLRKQFSGTYWYYLHYR